MSGYGSSQHEYTRLVKVPGTSDRHDIVQLKRTPQLQRHCLFFLLSSVSQTVRNVPPHRRGPTLRWQCSRWFLRPACAETETSHCTSRSQTSARTSGHQTETSAHRFGTSFWRSLFEWGRAEGIHCFASRRSQTFYSPKVKPWRIAKVRGSKDVCRAAHLALCLQPPVKMWTGLRLLWAVMMLHWTFGVSVDARRRMSPLCTKCDITKGWFSGLCVLPFMFWKCRASDKARRFF